MQSLFTENSDKFKSIIKEILTMSKNLVNGLHGHMNEATLK